MQKTLVIGLDPGDTTGYAMFDVVDEFRGEATGLEGIGDVFDVLGSVDLKKGGELRLLKMQEVEHIWGFDWWNDVSVAGGELAERVYEDIVMWLNGAGLRIDKPHEGVSVIVVMEDYIPSPQKAKAGAFDRSSVSPVGIGAVCWAQLQAMCGGNSGCVYFKAQTPSYKSMIDSRKHYVLKSLRSQGVRIRVQGHDMDALKHAYMAFR